jgi:hypothetical protein
MLADGAIAAPGAAPRCRGAPVRLARRRRSTSGRAIRHPATQSFHVVRDRRVTHLGHRAARACERADSPRRITTSARHVSRSRRCAARAVARTTRRESATKKVARSLFFCCKSARLVRIIDATVVRLALLVAPVFFKTC